MIDPYEPMLMLVEAEERKTTLAAEQAKSGGAAGDCYHEFCYEVCSGRHPTLRASRLY